MIALAFISVVLGGLVVAGLGIISRLRDLEPLDPRPDPKGWSKDGWFPLVPGQTVRLPKTSRLEWEYPQRIRLRRASLSGGVFLDAGTELVVLGVWETPPFDNPGERLGLRCQSPRPTPSGAVLVEDGNFEALP